MKLNVSLPAGATDIRLNSVDSDFVPEYDDETRLAGGDVQLLVSIFATLGLGSRVPLGTLAGDNSLDIASEYDDGEDLVWVEFVREAWLSFLVEYDPDKDEVQAVEFDSAWSPDLAHIWPEERRGAA